MSPPRTPLQLLLSLPCRHIYTEKSVDLSTTEMGAKTRKLARRESQRGLFHTPRLLSPCNANSTPRSATRPDARATCFLPASKQFTRFPLPLSPPQINQNLQNRLNSPLISLLFNFPLSTSAVVVRSLLCTPTVLYDFVPCKRHE